MTIILGMVVFMLVTISILVGYKHKLYTIKQFSKNQLKYIYPVSINKFRTKLILFIIGTILIALSLLDPIVYQEINEKTKKENNIILCLDISKSMLAEDIKPNRLERSKRELLSFINKTKRNIGLIVYTSKAIILTPITNDLSAIATNIQNISTDYISVGGTDLTAALFTALEAIGKHNNTDIIIISDGETHGSSSQSIIKELKARKIKVYTIGIGSEAGVPIPEYITGTKTGRYIQDSSGNAVISKLNKALLNEISENTGGRYLQVNNSNFIASNLIALLDNTKHKNEKSKELKKIYIYNYFLIPGIILLLITTALSINIHHILLITIMFTVNSGFSKPFNLPDWLSTNKANKEVTKQNIKEAKNIYIQNLKKDPLNETLHYNMGNVYAIEGNPEKAQEEWSIIKSKQTLTDTYFNQASLAYTMKDYETTIAKLIESLKLNPNSNDAKKNLEIALSMLQKQKQQQQKKQQGKQDQKEKGKEEQTNNKAQEKKYTKEEAEDMLKCLDKKKYLEPKENQNEDNNEIKNW